MPYQTRVTLKGYFSTRKKPTQQQFADLIDSFWHVQEAGGNAEPLAVVYCRPNGTLATSAGVFSFDERSKSMAVGISATAPGQGAFAFGYGATASSDGSFAFGNARTTRPGEMAFGSAVYNAGDAQCVDLSLASGAFPPSAPGSNLPPIVASLQLQQNETLMATILYADAGGHGAYLKVLFSYLSEVLTITVLEQTTSDGIQEISLQDVGDGLVEFYAILNEGAATQPTHPGEPEGGAYGHFRISASSILAYL